MQTLLLWHGAKSILISSNVIQNRNGVKIHEWRMNFLIYHCVVFMTICLYIYIKKKDIFTKKNILSNNKNIKILSNRSK